MDERAEFERLHGELAEAVLACRADPARHAVHSLRTSTRKLEAVLRKAIEDHREDHRAGPRGAGRLGPAAKPAMRELKRVRKAAGPVRDLDVHRRLAREVCERASAGATVEAREQVQDECERLDHKLKRRRDKGAKKLDKVLRKRELRLETALEDVAAAMKELGSTSAEGRSRKRAPTALSTAKEWARGAQPPDPRAAEGEFEDELHGYRKQTKAARYVAAMEESSQAAQRLAKQLKRMQDDIGRWHDLMLLGAEADKVVGKRSALAREARKECERALQNATEAVQRQQAQLHGRGGSSVPSTSHR